MFDPSQIQFEPLPIDPLSRPGAQKAAGPAAKASAAGQASSAGPASSGEASFAQALANARGLQLSNHAQKRLQSRDIQLDDERVNRLADAVDNVEKRGSKVSMVLMDDLAFIVNVRERTVVTAVDTKNQGSGVYSQIDSVAFAQQTQQVAKPKLDQSA